MASPTRSPNDLRNIIDFNEMFGDTVNQSMPSKSGSGIDNLKYENTLLRSRIEEQGQLICFLKQRADSQLIRNQNLEENDVKVKMLFKQSEEEIEQLKKTCAMLQSRFDELSNNHDEMIKFKDMYKLKNFHLEKEIQRLVDQSKQATTVKLQQKDAEIAKLLSELRTCNNQANTLQYSNAALQNEINDLTRLHDVTMGCLEKELCGIKKRLKQSQQEVTDVTSRYQENIAAEMKTFQNLQKEKEMLIDEVMQRGKLLQEKQVQNDSLTSKVKLIDSALETLKKEISEKQHLLELDMVVKDLQMEKKQAVRELVQLKAEFQAYRIHTNHLLTKEKELNCNLRKNLVS